jgi:hypothetical protein
MERSQYYLLLSQICQFLENDNTDTSFSLIDNSQTLEMPSTLLSQCRESATWNELEAQFLQAGGNICVSNAQEQEIVWSDWSLEDWLV